MRILLIDKTLNFLKTKTKCTFSYLLYCDKRILIKQLRNIYPVIVQKPELLLRSTSESYPENVSTWKGCTNAPIL